MPYVTGTGANFYAVATDSGGSGGGGSGGGGGGGGSPSGGAWAVGSGGTICRYVGGRWVSFTTGSSANFYGVSFWNPSYGLAVGSGGTICRWNGTSWVAVNTGTTGTFRNVVITSATTAYAVGDGGLFCVSTDGGLTWTPLVGGASADLNALAFSGGRLFGFGGGGTGFAVVPPGQPVNQPPLIAISYPTNNASFYACLHIPVTASASDPDGTVTNVTFYRGQFKLAEFAKPPRFGPFRTTFDTDALGTYELRAVATDNLGASTISEAVTIEVLPWPLDTAVAENYSDDQGCTLCLFGELGLDYVLEATETIGDTIVWKNLSTNTVPDPFLRVTDTNAPAFPKRFYRFQRAR